jgi:uncharacterized protein (UPF0332 family)
VKPGTEKILAKASDALAAAHRNLEAGAVDLAAGRAFYTMVHAARALLNERGEPVRTHVEICDRLRHHLGERIDPPLPDWLEDALSRRAEIDPDADTALTTSDAYQLIEKARTFLKTAHALVENQSPNTKHQELKRTTKDE